MSSGNIHAGVLARTAPFHKLDPAQLDALVRTLRVNIYRRREIVFASRRDAQGVFVLLDGRVKVARVDPRTGRELILFIVGPGELFGTESAGSPLSSSAVALDESIVGSMPASAFDQLVRIPEFAAEMVRLTADRLASVSARLDEMVFRDVSARLARVLLRLATEFPGDGQGATAINVRLTQQDLADLIGSTRESASVAVNTFKRQGLIAMRRQTIFIRDSDRLRRLTG
ncbi:MAG TPA: Crp/Fnr family transcriptional regulator [Candidatus Krumholzibacteria bacterium]|nr:Crp/Fnr family transcriptional regulator [Candidatus Krumholzibacteria bacterium]